MPRERRKHHRLPIEATQVQGATVNGHVLDLSMTGIAIETTRGLNIGTSHRLRITSMDRALVLYASVRWCRLQRICPKNNGDAVPIFRTGLKINPTDR